MLTSLLSGTLNSTPVEMQGPQLPSTTPARQIRSSALAAFVVAAGGVACDVGSFPSPVMICALEGATCMSCSPPRTHTRISHNTRLLAVPTAALPAKTRSKRGKRGGGSDGDDGTGGNDGDDYFFGGDDGFGGGGDDFGGDGGQGPSDGDNIRRWLQDAMLLWSVFCAWSTWNVLQHVTKQKATVTVPPPAFAAVGYEPLKQSA